MVHSASPRVPEVLRRPMAPLASAAVRPLPPRCPRLPFIRFIGGKAKFGARGASPGKPSPPTTYDAPNLRQFGARLRPMDANERRRFTSTPCRRGGLHGPLYTLGMPCHNKGGRISAPLPGLGSAAILLLRRRLNVLVRLPFLAVANVAVEPFQVAVHAVHAAAAAPRCRGASAGR